MSKKVLFSLTNFFVSVFVIALFSQSAFAQSPQGDQFQQLRSDVGIHGLTSNLHWLNNATYLGQDTLSFDGSSELEIVYRNVRTISPRLGVGFQVLTSFFSGGDSNFGIGSWGLGPIVRAYPLKTEQFQPYVQLNAMAGNNLAVGSLANASDTFDGFRIRLGLRGGAAIRLNNNVGLFTEFGYDWESSRLFKADARAFQANIGFDYYMFN